MMMRRRKKSRGEEAERGGRLLVLRLLPVASAAEGKEVVV